MAGVQCLKRLYFIVHQQEITPQTDGADTLIVEQGREIGLLARRLFPGGLEVKEGPLDDAIRTTKELLTNPEVSGNLRGHV